MNPEPMNPFNIFLIGYRCTGKSSVGKRLAARLDWPFIDTDTLLVAEAGLSIKEIVAKRGWEVFRSMEHAIMKKVCTPDQRVVATGGGVVLKAENVKLMKKSGRLIWLRAKPETIQKRMMQDSGTEAFRPALTSTDSVAEIGVTLAERKPSYQSAMDFVLDTDDRGIDKITDIILEKLKNHYKNQDRMEHFSLENLKKGT